MRPLPHVDPEAGGHRGLWHDKFCDTWGPGWSMGGPDKLAWIRRTSDQGPVGSVDELNEYGRRLFDLVESRAGAAVMVVARWRFVTGLGLSHPTENGFAWHPTLGTPYLPGSSAKGLARAWAEVNVREDKLWRRVIGDETRGGTVSFLDAVPVRPVTLEPDVLTPHYANWTGQDLPADWRSPNPVPFLVAAQGWSMLCSVIPLAADDAGDALTALTWLTEALSGTGAGAKTAVGYGHFDPDRHDSTLDAWRRERARRSATATPEGRWRVIIGDLPEQQVLERVREHLEKAPLSDAADKRGFVTAVLGLAAAWRRGEKNEQATPHSAKKLKEYARLVDAAAAELGLDLRQEGQ